MAPATKLVKPMSNLQVKVSPVEPDSDAEQLWADGRTSSGLFHMAGRIAEHLTDNQWLDWFVFLLPGELGALPILRHIHISHHLPECLSAFFSHHHTPRFAWFQLPRQLPFAIVFDLF